MNGILGKITNIRRLKSRRGAAAELHRLEVSFKPACVMPDRTKPPEWLKDKILKVTREVADPREVGGPGDSIVLTPAESASWLFPLVADPVIVYGELPARIEITLRWWKDKKPGEYTVHANGRQRMGKFTKDGKVFRASVATREFFDVDPSLPVSFEVAFDKLTAGCAVLPADRPFYHKLRTIFGDRHRVESDWYAVDICSGKAGGGITMLREKGRGVDHFRSDDDLIRGVFDHGGHIDRVALGWSDSMTGVAMASAAARREGQALRLSLDGVLDKGKNIHTSVAYTLFDRLPLISLQRDVQMHKPEKKDDKKDDKKPSEPIDNMLRVTLAFRAAYLAERGIRSGSRVLSVDGDRFAAVRCAETHESLGTWRSWRLADGWVVMEHPRRRECTMYVFDGHNAPALGTWLGERVVTLDPEWMSQPTMPESGRGSALALIAGELCGASVAGAWVACRRPAPGGVECALVGRFREPPPDPTANIQLGDQSARLPLQRMLLPGVGTVFTASTVFSKGGIRSKFEVAAAGIPARRRQ